MVANQSSKFQGNMKTTIFSLTRRKQLEEQSNFSFRKTLLKKQFKTKEKKNLIILKAFKF